MSIRTRWVVVDDTDPSFNFSGDWTVRNDTFSGYNIWGLAYQATQHGTSAQGNFSFSFSGTEVQLLGTSGVIVAPSGRFTPQWNCYMDREGFPAVDPWAGVGNNWPLCTWGAGGREPAGSHTLSVNATAGEGGVFWIDSVRYRPSPDLTLVRPTVMIEHVDPSISYSGSWESITDVANRENAVIATKPGSTVSLRFKGTKVIWYGWIPDGYPTGNSTASYSIDEETAKIIDVFASTKTYLLQNQIMFETEILPAGDHTMVLTYDGPSAPLVLDYLLVEDGDPQMPSGTPNSFPSAAVSSTRSSQVTRSGTSTSPSSSSRVSSTSDPSGSDKPPLGAIIGGAIGGIAVIVFLAIFFVILKRREKRNQPQISLSPGPSYTPVPTNPNNQPSPTRQPPNFPTNAGTNYHHQHDPPSMTDYATAQAAIIQPYYVTQSQSLDIKVPISESRLSPLRRGQVVPDSPDGPIISDATSSISGNQVMQGQPVGHAHSFYPGGVAGAIDYVRHEDSGIRLPRTTVVSLPPVYTRE